MELTDDLKAFLDERRFAVLATINADGSIHQTVMWYLLDGNTIIMNTLDGRQKDVNMERDARISVCIEAEQRYLTMTGNVVIDNDPARGQETARALAVRYGGEAAAEIEMATVFSKQHRITLEMPIDQIDAHGF